MIVQFNLTGDALVMALTAACAIMPKAHRTMCATIAASLPALLAQGFKIVSPSVVCGDLLFCDVCCVTDTMPEGVHLSSTGNPSQMAVMWTTKNSTATSRFRLGLAPGNYSLDVQGTQAGTYLPYLWNGHLHTALATSLEPSTRYYYVVGDDAGGWSKEMNFRTDPADYPNIRLRVVGDMGAEEYSDSTVARLSADVQAGLVDMLLHVGDISYANSAQWLWDVFLRKVQDIAGYVPYMVCPGNHEVPYNFTAYRHRFRMPGVESGSNTNLYHSFDYSLAHFLFYDTEMDFSPGSPQYRWMESDLKRAFDPARRKNRPWLIMLGHRPMYCSNGKNDAEDCITNARLFRTYLDPLLARYQVDLMISAHEHSYERSWPVFNETVSHSYDNPPYPIHIVNGAAGCKEQLDVSWLDPAPAWSNVQISEYGYAHLDITPTSLRWQYVRDSDGYVVDDFTITKKPSSSTL